MRRLVLPLSVAALTLLVASGPAGAFTVEPVGGGAGGSGTSGNLADPDQPVGRIGNAEAGERGSKGSTGSPFSLSITGPGMSDGPAVNRSGIGNDHLYWKNTTNRHERYDRNSTTSRHPYR